MGGHRRPLPCLAFVAPILLTYELGIVWLGGDADAMLRTGADAWLRRSLATVGLTDHWLLPMALVVALLVWHVVSLRGGASLRWSCREWPPRAWCWPSRSWA